MNSYSSNDSRGLTIVLPKKGRLCDDFGLVLRDAGLQMEKAGSRVDFGTLSDRTGALAPVQALIQRPMDALRSILLGVADLAVVGRDTLMEFNAAAKSKNYDAARVREVTALDGISPCRLVIAAPVTRVLERSSDLNGLRFATSYPETLKAWLETQSIVAASIEERDGGVEDTVRQGIADVIFDVVQTGESLRENGLAEKFSVAESTALLVRRAGERSGAQQRLEAAIINRLTEALPRQTPERRLACG